MTIVMPPGQVSCIGGTKYPHCIVLYCIINSHVMFAFQGERGYPGEKGEQVICYLVCLINCRFCLIFHLLHVMALGETHPVYYTIYHTIDVYQP